MGCFNHQLTHTTQELVKEMLVSISSLRYLRREGEGREKWVYELGFISAV